MQGTVERTWTTTRSIRVVHMRVGRRGVCLAVGCPHCHCWRLSLGLSSPGVYHGTVIPTSHECSGGRGANLENALHLVSTGNRWNFLGHCNLLLVLLLNANSCWSLWCKLVLKALRELFGCRILQIYISLLLLGWLTKHQTVLQLWCLLTKRNR